MVYAHVLKMWEETHRSSNLLRCTKPDWWNGRHVRLKSGWPHGRAGSNPVSGTTYCSTKSTSSQPVRYGLYYRLKVAWQEGILFLIGWRSGKFPCFDLRIFGPLVKWHNTSPATRSWEFDSPRVHCLYRLYWMGL